MSRHKEPTISDAGMQVGGGLAQVFRLVVCNISFTRNESICATASVKKRSQSFVLLVALESLFQRNNNPQNDCLVEPEWFTFCPQICPQTGRTHMLQLFSLIRGKLNLASGVDGQDADSSPYRDSGSIYEFSNTRNLVGIRAGVGTRRCRDRHLGRR